MLDIDIMHPLNSTLLLFKINDIKKKIRFENGYGNDTENVVKVYFGNDNKKRLRFFILNKE